MVPGWQEFILYLVFASGTAASLFAFLWGRRLKKLGCAPKAVREDPAFKEFLEGGLAIGGGHEPNDASRIIQGGLKGGCNGEMSLPEPSTGTHDTEAGLGSEYLALGLG